LKAVSQASAARHTRDGNINASEIGTAYT
jgi:hypothetical protein